MTEQPVKKELIDANAFIEFLERKTRCAYPNMFPGLLEAIDLAKDFPTVDAVEVVRCKDCRFYETAEYYPDGTKQVCRLLKRQMCEDAFCSCGERRTE